MAQIPQHLPELLTIKEAATVLKCHQNTLRLWDKDGTLPMIRFGKRKTIRYNKQDIVNLLDKQQYNSRTKESSLLLIENYIKKNALKIYEDSLNMQKSFFRDISYTRGNNKEFKCIHIKILLDICSYVQDIPSGILVFKKWGELLASQALDDKLTIEQVMDSIIFMKQSLRAQMDNHHEFKQLTSSDVIVIGHGMNSLYDIIISTVAVVYHADYKKHAEENIKNVQIAQHRLKESEDKLMFQLQLTRNIAESTATIIFVAGRDGNIHYINPEAQKVFQYTIEELQGKSLHEIIHYKYPDGRPFPIAECPLGHVFADGKPVRDFETVFYKKDGSPVPVICSNMPIFENGTVWGEVLTMQNIKKRKKLERSKDEFIGIASHELKTPITSLKAFVQLFQKRMKGKVEAKDLFILKSITKQTDRLTSLINDLLNISKLESDKLTFRMQRVNITGLVRKIVADMQLMTQSHTFTVEGSIDKTLKIDINRIEQVLLNLLTNAIKYSPEAKTVIVRLKQTDNEAIISVQDFGMGIAKKDQQRIFERFYRTAERERQRQEGVGLGLYISSEIVKRHGGKIWVESKKGKGSVFCFSLPFNKWKCKKNHL